MKVSVTVQLGITVFIAACAVAGAAMLFIILAGRIESSQTALIDLESRIANGDEARAEAASSRGALALRVESLDRVSRFFLGPDRPVGFIETLEGLARRTRTTAAIDIDEANSTPLVYTFRLTVEGSDTAVLRYLDLVLLLPYEVRVDDAALQHVQPGDIRSGTVAGQTTPTARLGLTFKVRRAISPDRGNIQ